jgi:hypothetical protein
MRLRDQRRLMYPLLGVVVGVIGAFVILLIASFDLHGPTSGGAWVGAAFVGSVAGFVGGFLLAATRSDGEDEAASYGGEPGRADAPVIGAEAADAIRAARRRRRGRRLTV